MKKILNIGTAPILPAGSPLTAHGQIAFANEGEFNESFLSEPLSAYAVGSGEEDTVRQELELVAPSVRVPRRFEYRDHSAGGNVSDGSGNEDARALGAEFTEVEYFGEIVNAKTTNRGLRIRLDKDDFFPGIEEDRVARLVNRLHRNQLRAAIAILEANDTATTKVYNGTAGEDPDADFLAEIIASGDARGVDCNQVLFGTTAWQRRVASLRAQDAAGAMATSGFTPEQLAGFLGVDRVVKSRERFATTRKATSKTQVVNNKVFFYQAEPNASTDDISNIKRFVTPAGDMLYRVYREETAKFVVLTVEHYSDVVCTDTRGIRSVTINLS